MPKETDNILEFTNFQYQHQVSYVIYADFEALITKVDNSSLDNSSTVSMKLNSHEACGYSYVIIDPDGKSVKPAVVYRGPNAVDNFLEKILLEKDNIAEKLTTIVPICMSPQDEEDFRRATHCYLCKKILNADRVKDHDHLSGKYRGALHNLCNIKYRLQKKIPVIFHNLKHYDSHLIMQGLGKIKNREFHVTATNLEKYISFSISKKYNKINVTLSFVDSLLFMNASLERLVSNLSPDKFQILNENITHPDRNLLLRKGVYPYEYMSSFDKFDETKLPPLKDFHSTLTGGDISMDDFTHAQTVWKAF